MGSVRPHVGTEMLINIIFTLFYTFKNFTKAKPFQIYYFEKNERKLLTFFNIR